MGDVINSFKKFNWVYIPVVLFLSFIAYLLRAVRWHYYLRELGVDLTVKDTFILYFTSLSVLVVPLLASGVIKAGFIKMKTGADVSKTLPIVFIERITDLIGMAIIASICFLFIDFDLIDLFLVSIFLIGSIGIIQNRKICHRLLELGARIKKLKKFMHYVKNSYDSAYIMLRPKPLFIASIISLASWSLVGGCMYLIILGLNIDVNIWVAFFVFISPSILGVVTQLPGGIGAEETGIVGLLHLQFDIDKSNATAAMLLIRLATLWYGIVIGVISLKIFKKEIFEKPSNIEKK